MTDVFTAEKRSAIMQAVRSKNTGPEQALRRALHKLGFRYRLHVRNLPGSPDLVFPGRRKVIFVHGCFWHRHGCRKGRSMPATRKAFWEAKFKSNRTRDRRHRERLRRDGWALLTVWECQLAADRAERTIRRVVRFLDRRA